MANEALAPVPALRIDRSLTTPQLAIHSVICRAHVSGRSEEEPVDSPRLILPRRGLFIYHLQDQAYVADPTSAFLLDSGDVCRVSHPMQGGDDCTVLALNPALLEEAFGASRWLDQSSPVPRFRVKRVGSNPGIQLALRALQSGLGAPEDPLLAEEIAMHLLAGFARMSPDGPADRPPSRSAQWRYVERARACLASSPCGALTLDAIGKAVHCSPFHLARHFKQATGTSMHQYLTALRMALALDRLADGEGDLSRLALDLGFASHSHFSARFRLVFGIAPQAARRLLTRTRLAEMRRILTAQPLSGGLPS